MQRAIIAFLCFLSSFAQAEEAFDLEAFKRIPVMNRGRVMPMDSYAQQALLQLSGRTSYAMKYTEEGSKEKMSAVEWIAKVMFKPEDTIKDRVFLINDPEVAEALDIEPQDDRRYSFEMLQQTIMTLGPMAEKVAQMADDERGRVDKEVYRTYGNLSLYYDLIRSFQFALPNPEFTIENSEVKKFFDLPVDQNEFTFWDVHKNIGRLRGTIEPLLQKEQEAWTPFEAGLFRLANTMFQWSRRYDGVSLTLLPSTSHEEEMWISVWDAINLRLEYQSIVNAISNLQRLAQAYLAQDQAALDKAAHDHELFVKSQLGEHRELETIGLELAYNKWKLFYQSKIFYLLAFILAFVAAIALKKPIRLTALVLLILGLIPHTAGIVMRMMIMGRPPMTNLYATFLFVAWGGVLLLLIMELIQKNSMGLLGASFCGYVLLMIAERFGAEGDTMGKMVAVLRSNFWLSTHVVAITLGYVGCIVAGLVGHMYLFTAAFAPKRTQILKSVKIAVFALLGFGLTLSFLGTMLGGVWADQSWGRFWGWDPKENGALLIVIWCSILFHARLGKMIGDVGFAAGSVLGIIVVMIAWLGVNLLGVGLHSYGFTEGLSYKLYVYIIVQINLVLIIAAAARYRLLQKPFDLYALPVLGVIMIVLGGTAAWMFGAAARHVPLIYYLSGAAALGFMVWLKKAHPPKPQPQAA